MEPPAIADGPGERGERGLRLPSRLGAIAQALAVLPKPADEGPKAK